jgi:hypothetical protein
VPCSRPFDSRVAVAHDLPAPIRDQDHGGRLPELRREERGVCRLDPRRSREEARRVEVVVQPDEERAEQTEGREIRGRRGTDGYIWQVG